MLLLTDSRDGGKWIVSLTQMSALVSHSIRAQRKSEITRTVVGHPVHSPRSFPDEYCCLKYVRKRISVASININGISMYLGICYAMQEANSRLEDDSLCGSISLLGY